MKYAIFFRFSKFSYTNLHVLAGLERRFPDVKFVDIDLRPAVTLRKLPVVASALEALMLYGPKRLMADGGKALTLRTARGWAFLTEVAETLSKALNNDGPPLFTFQTQTIFNAKLPNIPHFVYTDHAHLVNLYYPSFQIDQLWHNHWISAEARALREADGVFVMSRHVETVLREVYHLDPARLARVGVGCNATSNGSAQARAPATVLFVGLHWERKGGPTLIKAMDRVVAQRPDARLVVVGCRPEVSRPYLDIMGRIPLEAVAQYYQTATLFCLPTKIEPFGIVALEAMSNRLPPILPNLGAFPDFITHDETGYLFKPEDDVDLSNVILFALNKGPTALDAMGERGRALVEERYSWEGAVDRMGSFIEKTIRQG